MNKWEMARLLELKVIVGVLVALAAKVMLVRPPPGILALTEAMSVGLLELENKGDREKFALLGEFAMNICPLFAEEAFIQSQESWKR